jgi:hypothetical protein
MMRITESKLRRVIREVIKESEEGLTYSEEDYPYHHKILNLFEHFFNKDYWDKDARLRVMHHGFRGQVEHIIKEDFHDEGLSDLLVIPNFLSIFVEKGIVRFIESVSQGYSNIDSACEDWNNWIENSSEETCFNFIDSVCIELGISRR